VNGAALGLTLCAVAQCARADTVASLLADPRRLDEVQRGCKVNAPSVSEALCRQAAQAIRLRFRGKGVAYTPRPTVISKPPVAVTPHRDGSRRPRS
jgi:hypothetical protein